MNEKTSHSSIHSLTDLNDHNSKRSNLFNRLEFEIHSENEFGDFSTGGKSAIDLNLFGHKIIKRPRVATLRIIQFHFVTNHLAIYNPSSTMNPFYASLLLFGISSILASQNTFKCFKQRVRGLFFNPVDNGDSVANSFRGHQFRRAMQQGDMYTANNIFNDGSDELKKYSVKYLTSLKSSKLVELIKNAYADYRTWILRILLIHADQSLVEEVLGALKPSNWLLSWVARSADLTRISLKDSLAFWARSMLKGSKSGLIKYGVNALFRENKTECLDPLLIALKEEHL